MHEHTAELLGGSEKRRMRTRGGPALLPGYNVFFQRSNTKTCQIFFHKSEWRHVQTHCQICFFCKSRKKTSPLQTLCQIFFFCKSRAKDMFSTYTLSDHFFFANDEQRLVHHKHIFKSFFANRERRHVHYKDIVKPFFCNSRTKTCSVHTLCQIILFCKSRT